MILASKSPRRKELLSLITKDFEILSAEVDETIPNGYSPSQAVEYLSRIKAEPFQNHNDIIIGADTIVTINNNILGKPENRTDAYNMLKMLSGKTHSVITGVSIIKNDKISTFHEETLVTFLELCDKDINNYLDTNEYTDKAGAYGIQGYGSLLVKEIKGDYFNVVGLPVSHLNIALKEFKEN